MNNILRIILILIFITSCSSGKKIKLWSKSETKQDSQIEVEEVGAELIIDKTYKKEKTLNTEFSPNLKISLLFKPANNSLTNNNNNNIGRVDYNGSLNTVSKFKFSKIKNIFQYNPKILFDKENIIFFDGKGSIFKFDDNFNLVWKKNYYSKSEKKQNPILMFAKNKNKLIVTDNIAKYYALDINTGNLLWSKKNISPFNSQIKTYKDKFFAVDFENVLRAYRTNDGNEIWNQRTENTFIRSQRKLSIIIIDDNVYFNNSLGDINAININTGELLWQTPTQSSLSNVNVYALENSELISDNKNLYFSNNKEKFFSIDLKTGAINWQQAISSSLRSSLVENYIFTISNNGFLIIIEKDTGNIIRMTSIFKKQSKKFMRSKKNRDSIHPVGFIVGLKNIYLTTNKGKLYIIDILTGQTMQILKIDSEKISNPFMLSQNLYIIKDNSIIKLD